MMGITVTINRQVSCDETTCQNGAHLDGMAFGYEPRHVNMETYFALTGWWHAPDGRSSFLNQSRFGRRMAHSRPTCCAGSLPVRINWRTVFSCKPSSSAAWGTDTISTVRRMLELYSVRAPADNVNKNNVDNNMDSDKIETKGIGKALED